MMSEISFSVLGSITPIHPDYCCSSVRVAGPSYICMCVCGLLAVYLSIRGEDPKEHAVRQELVVIRCAHS